MIMGSTSSPIRSPLRSLGPSPSRSPLDDSFVLAREKELYQELLGDLDWGSNFDTDRDPEPDHEAEA